MIRIHLLVAGTRFEIDGESLHDVLRDSQFLRGLPEVCPLCNEPVRFNYRTATDQSKKKEFEFWELVCLGTPQHQNTFGQHMGTNEFFYKEREWKVRPTRQDGGGGDSSYPDEPDYAPRGNQGGGQNRGGGGDYGGRR